MFALYQINLNIDIYAKLPWRLRWAPDIHDKILEVFAEKGIDAKKIFFNGFDVTNTLSGERGGLQRYMRNDSPFSKYIICRSHRFTLVFKHLMTRYQVLNSLDSLLLQL